MERTVLDKTLTTGQHLVLTFTTTSPTNHNGYTAAIDDVIVSEGFSTTIHRDTTGIPEAPHAIEIPGFPDARNPHRYRVPVALTTTEADQIDQVVAEVHDLPRQRRTQKAKTARAANPSATTWELPPTGHRPEIGDTFRDAHGTPVTVLNVQRTWTEDGPSFYLPEEQGNIYTPRVREATSDEIEQMRTRERGSQHQRLTEARERVYELFVYAGNNERIPDAEKATYHDCHPRGGAIKLHHLGVGPDLVLADNAIYSVTSGAGAAGGSHPFWRHPITPQRAEVVAALVELEPWVQVLRPVPRPVDNPEEATTPEGTITRIGKATESERGTMLHGIVLAALKRREHANNEAL